jgi:NTE family protein
MDRPRRALVLSGGGLFGAWQAGAWSVLQRFFEPDVIIGASIGSLNGWAIAGGCPPDELESLWKEKARTGRFEFRLPRRPLDGIVDFSEIERWIRELCDAYRPKTEFYAVITELMRLRPRLVEGGQIDWRHLASSCAMLGLMPQQRIGNVTYSDGGLLGALPLWAAADCGATHVIGLQVMPRMPWAVRAALRPLRLLRGKRRARSGSVAVFSPLRPLGGWRQALLWENARIEEWILQGREDAEAWLSRPEAQAVFQGECVEA